MSRFFSVCALGYAVSVGGCSALIDPDPGELGGADAAVSCDTGCDDSIACTADSCVAMSCVHSPSNALCPTGQRCDVTRGCVASTCSLDSECDDGATCTTDRCDPTLGCINTPDAMKCDDSVGCTVDACTPGSGTADGCTHMADNTRCTFCFGAGATCDVVQGCTGSTPRDCSDGNACTSDVCDETKSACANEPRDEDGDGAAPNVIGTMFCGGTDCDDADATTYPGAAELCDGKDNDCDGTEDEGCGTLPDTCDTAFDVMLSAGKATLTGTFAPLTADLSTSCGDSRGRDAVYAIPVTSTSDIIIDSGTSAAAVVLAAGTTCSMSGFSTSCAGAISGASKRSRLIVHNFNPDNRGETLYLLVDAATATEMGTFNVTVEVRARAADTCQAPLDLGLGGTVYGIFDGAGSTRGSCQGLTTGSGREAAFTMAMPSDGNVDLTAIATQFAPTLYVRDECSSNNRDNELECEAGTGASGTRTVNLSVSSDAANDVYIFLDSSQNTANGASYSLKVVP
jgi:hypothetical protein